MFRLNKNIVTMIFKYLITGSNIQNNEINKFINFRFVCKFWKTLIDTDNYLWRDIYMS